MRFSAPPAVPAPDHDHSDAPLPGGDVVLLPVVDGPTFSLRFGGPYEAFITLDGQRLMDATSPEGRRLLIWVNRRLAPLYRALDEKHALCGVVGRDDVQVGDVADLDRQEFLDHSQVRRIFSGTALPLPPFVALGEVGNLHDLMARARTMYAAGALVEVRVEDDGVVSARRQVRVAR